MPARPAIQRHEWFAVAVAFVYFFCVLAAYYVIRPVRDQLSAAVGSTSLPIFYAATFVATLALTPFFGALVARFPRRKFVPIVYLFFIAGMIAFIPAFQMQDVDRRARARLDLLRLGQRVQSVRRRGVLELHGRPLRRRAGAPAVSGHHARRRDRRARRAAA